MNSQESVFRETLQETLELSAPVLTSGKLVLIFKFIYKPQVTGFHSFLSLKK